MVRTQRSYCVLGCVWMQVNFTFEREKATRAGITRSSKPLLLVKTSRTTGSEIIHFVDSYTRSWESGLNEEYMSFKTVLVTLLWKQNWYTGVNALVKIRLEEEKLLPTITLKRFYMKWKILVYSLTRTLTNSCWKLIQINENRWKLIQIKMEKA